MSIENVNGANIKSQIQSIANSENAGKRSGRIEILKQVSELGKELLDALNSEDKTLVEIEGSYDDVLKEFEELNTKIETAKNKVEQSNLSIEDAQTRANVLLDKQESGEELTDEEQRELDLLTLIISQQMSVSENSQNDLQSLTQQQGSIGATMENYNNTLNDIVDNMQGYADAGDAVKQASHNFGRSKMADNLEKNSSVGNALKRNESSWISLSFLGVENDTEQYVKRMSWEGMDDGADGVDMTYHDSVCGGYHAEYDVMQYGIGGELRDLTAKTWSYGKTVNTAANDMAGRANTQKNRIDPPETNA